MINNFFNHYFNINKMKICHLLIFLLLIGIVTISCKKNNDKTQQPCPGGCGVLDFNLIDYQPAWSPDGKHIAFYHIDKVLAKNGIWLITQDGKENRLWHSGIGAENPCWSPDGQWIVFSQGAQIWKKKLNGDSLTRITNEGRNFFPAWSPNGKLIANHRSYFSPEPQSVQGIWIMDIHGNNKEQVFSGNCGFPFWNHLNNILFIRGVTNSKGEVIGDSLKSYLFVNKNIANIFFMSGDNTYPQYSAINNKICYTSQPVNGLPQIWVIKADGTSQKQMTQIGGYTSDWSPNESQIVFTDSRALNGRLWLMNADGSNKQQLSFDKNF